MFIKPKKANKKHVFKRTHRNELMSWVLMWKFLCHFQDIWGKSQELCSLFTGHCSSEVVNITLSNTFDLIRHVYSMKLSIYTIYLCLPFLSGHASFDWTLVNDINRKHPLHAARISLPIDSGFMLSTDRQISLCASF